MDLKQERENIIAQRDKAMITYHQATGALMLLDVLIAEQEQSEVKE